jgi:hypothetical protein
VFPPSKESPSLAPDLNEPLDGPSHQVGDLSVAYLDDAVDAYSAAIFDDRSAFAAERVIDLQFDTMGFVSRGCADVPGHICLCVRIRRGRERSRNRSADL